MNNDKLQHILCLSLYSTKCILHLCKWIIQWVLFKPSESNDFVVLFDTVSFGTYFDGTAFNGHIFGWNVFNWEKFYFHANNLGHCPKKLRNCPKQYLVRSQTIWDGVSNCDIFGVWVQLSLFSENKIPNTLQSTSTIVQSRNAWSMYKMFALANLIFI